MVVSIVVDGSTAKNRFHVPSDRFRCDELIKNIIIFSSAERKMFLIAQNVVGDGMSIIIYTYLGVRSEENL